MVILCAGSAWAAGLAETHPSDSYLRLKTRFETLARRNYEADALACLAVETAALAWTLAAIRLAETQETKELWRDRAADFEKSRSASRDWDERLRQGLAAYYQALGAVTALWVPADKNPALADEWRVLVERTERELAALGERPDLAMEKEVLTGGLLGLTAILARSVSGGALDQSSELILRAVAKETEAARRRDDIHRRGKLALIYAANVQGLTDLIFLLSQTVDPPSGRDLDAVRTALNKAGAGRSLPDALSLAWIAQTQACLPLAYRLSARPAPGSDL